LRFASVMDFYYFSGGRISYTAYALLILSGDMDDNGNCSYDMFLYCKETLSEILMKKIA